jgi:predicted GNAT superfamily acetyltransferase
LTVAHTVAETACRRDEPGKTSLTETIVMRDAALDDTTAIVALNDAVVAVTSPMDAARFRALHAVCAFCTVVERERQVIGFILAMRDGAAYDNGNFRWFADRLRRFVYIDRIVISDAARGLGLGTMLYDRLAQAAQRLGDLTMAAEMDLVPANPGSIAFHRNYGFVELGTRTLDNGKVVSMQVKGL